MAQVAGSGTVAPVTLTASSPMSLI
jgi:hypothetical protein